MKVVANTGDKKTLLERALAVPVARESRVVGPTDQELGLAVAWYRGIVATKQVNSVTQIPQTSVGDKMQRWLKAGIASGRVKLVMDGDDETET